MRVGIGWRSCRRRGFQEIENAGMEWIGRCWIPLDKSCIEELKGLEDYIRNLDEVTDSDQDKTKSKYNAWADMEKRNGSTWMSIGDDANDMT
jgi:hypothetical protein